VRHIQRQLQLYYSELNIRVVNKGISGNTIRDLARRWQQDVMAQKPDRLFVFIGVNDVWRMMENRFEDSVPLGEFEATYRDLLAQVAEMPAKITLIAPFIIEPNQIDPFRVRLAEYCAVIKELATDVGAKFISTQQIFDRALTQHAPPHWSDDRVHPTLAGHQLIADAILASVKLDTQL
jgi:lysophospholipase L1-like esterase